MALRAIKRCSGSYSVRINGVRYCVRAYEPVPEGTPPEVVAKAKSLGVIVLEPGQEAPRDKALKLGDVMGGEKGAPIMIGSSSPRRLKDIYKRPRAAKKAENKKEAPEASSQSSAMPPLDANEGKSDERR